MADSFRMLSLISLDDQAFVWDAQVEITRTTTTGFWFWKKTNVEKFYKRISGHNQVWRDINIGYVEENRELIDFVLANVFLERRKHAAAKHNSSGT